MANTFKIKVSSPSGIMFEDDVIQVEIKTNTGYLALLANHSPIIGSFLPSICYIRDIKNNRVSTIINQGIFQFKNNVLTIFTDFFCFSNKLNPNVIQEMQNEIDHAISSKTLKDDNIIKDLQVQLQENINKLKKITNK